MVAFAISPCFVFKNPFTFNPVRVPSFKVDGVKEPICSGCIEFINKQRQEQGVEPFEIHPDAYGACEEDELI